MAFRRLQRQAHFFGPPALPLTDFPAEVLAPFRAWTQVAAGMAGVADEHTASTRVSCGDVGRPGRECGGPGRARVAQASPIRGPAGGAGVPALPSTVRRRRPGATHCDQRGVGTGAMAGHLSALPPGIAPRGRRGSQLRERGLSRGGGAFPPPRALPPNSAASALSLLSRRAAGARASARFLLPTTAHVEGAGKPRAGFPDCPGAGLTSYPGGLPFWPGFAPPGKNIISAARVDMEWSSVLPTRHMHC